MNPRSDVLPSPIGSTSLIWCFTVVLLNSPFLIQPKLLGIRFRQFLQPCSYPTTRIWFIDFANFIHFPSLKRMSKFSGWNSSPIRSQLMSAINLHFSGGFSSYGTAWSSNSSSTRPLSPVIAAAARAVAPDQRSQKWRADGFEGCFYGFQRWDHELSWMWC